MKRRITAATIALCAGAAAIGAQAGVAAAATQPEVKDIGLLFTHTAERGTLRPLEGKPGRFVLRLKDPASQVVWFSDRPAHHTGQIPVGEFVRAWRDFGFKADPPNAALTLLHGDRDADTVVLRLGEPRYRPKRHLIRFWARELPHATGNLSDFESHRDRRVPRRFEDASLFIDDASGRVINGCVIQPYTSCPGANLADAFLTNANLNGANFSNATLSEASLGGADLNDANLADANLADANLPNATLAEASLAGADLNNANLDNANLGDADLTGAELTGANLTGANLTGAILTGAIFCQTTMPDGSTNNSDC